MGASPKMTTTITRRATLLCLRTAPAQTSQHVVTLFRCMSTAKPEASTSETTTKHQSINRAEDTPKIEGPKVSLWQSFRIIALAIKSVGLSRFLMGLRPAKMSSGQLQEALKRLKEGDSAKQEQQLELLAQQFAQMQAMKDIHQTQLAEFRKNLETQKAAELELTKRTKFVTGLPKDESEHSERFHVNPMFGQLWRGAISDRANELKKLPNMYWVKTGEKKMKADLTGENTERDDNTTPKTFK
eukprot:c3633_g1_i1.p1 GENE.c3633_g1_i1~~c3633_g1_i1.p1  ORF type:complete len:243 (+),score=42.00 c3633_g1_i1:1-729(+)